MKNVKILLNIIKNAVLRKKKNIVVSNTKGYHKTITLLYKAGYIQNYTNINNFIKIQFKYYNNKSLVIKTKEIDSGKLMTHARLNKINQNEFLLILTTFGVLSHFDCIHYKVGGVLICTIR